MMSDPLKMHTIPEAAGAYGVAVHAVRGWVKSGALPAVKAGKKFLICDIVLRDFLMRGTNDMPPEPIEFGKIRRLG